MNKIKTFLKEHKKTIIIGIAIVAAAPVLAIVAEKVKNGDFADDSIMITNNPDGSFTVSEALPE